MLMYLRLAAGSYSAFDLLAAHPNGNVTSDYAVLHDMTQGQDDTLIVCPQATFYSNGYCFGSPYLSSTITAILIKIANVDYWRIGAQYSDVVAGSDQITYIWEVDDVVITSFIAGKSMDHFDIPASAFIEESTYNFKFWATNPDNTFYEQATANFVPISCHYYHHEDTSNYTKSISVDEPAGVNEVTFELSLVEDQTYCSDILWYSKLSPQVDFYISPQVLPVPQIQYTIEGTFITVTIPRDEQYKFPAQTPVNIVMGVQWTNPAYESIVASGPALLFQNTVLEVTFTVPARTILPKVGFFYDNVLQGEAVTLNATNTTVTSVRNPQLTMEWMCPAGVAGLCVNKTGAVVTFNWTEFVAVSGSYSKPYVFTLFTTWTQDNGDKYYNEHNVTITWWDIALPLIDLTSPNRVITTSKNVFTLSVSNYDVATSTELLVDWSVTPNITDTAKFSLNQEKSVMTVETNAFAINTEYNMMVTVQHTGYSRANDVVDLLFTTREPPQPGVIVVEPKEGYLTETKFNITIKDWISRNEPIQFRLWTTAEDDAGNLVPLEVISNWLADTEMFSSFLPNTDPLIVEVSDQSGESAYVEIIDINVLVRSLSAVEISERLKQTHTTNSRLSLMDAMTTMLEVTDDMSFEESQASRSTLAAQCAIETHQMDEQHMNTVITKVASILSELLNDDSYINDDIVTQAVEALKGMKTASTELLANMRRATFRNKLATTVSSLLLYTNRQIESLTGRHLYSTSSLSSIREINSQIILLKDHFLDLACSSTLVDEEEFTQSTAAFSSSYEIFEPKSTAVNRVYDLGRESSINVKVADLVREFMPASGNPDKQLCMQVTGFNKNPLVHLGSTMVDYETPFVEVQVLELISGVKQATEDLGVIVTPMIMEFKVDPATFFHNQTQCMSFKETTKEWTDSGCQTLLREENMVECVCNQIQTKIFGLVTDTSRIVDSAASMPTEDATEDSENEFLSLTSVNFNNEMLLPAVAVAFVWGISVLVMALRSKTSKTVIDDSMLKMVASLTHTSEAYVELKTYLFREKITCNGDVTSQDLLPLLKQVNYFPFMVSHPRVVKFLAAAIKLTQLSLAALVLQVYWTKDLLSPEVGLGVGAILVLVCGALMTNFYPKKLLRTIKKKPESSPVNSNASPIPTVSRYDEEHKPTEMNLACDSTGLTEPKTVLKVIVSALAALSFAALIATAVMMAKGPQGAFLRATVSFVVACIVSMIFNQVKLRLQAKRTLSNSLVNELVEDVQAVSQASNHCSKVARNGPISLDRHSSTGHSSKNASFDGNVSEPSQRMSLNNPVVGAAKLPPVLFKGGDLSSSPSRMEPHSASPLHVSEDIVGRKSMGLSDSVKLEEGGAKKSPARYSHLNH